MKKDIKNLQASVKARLQNNAKETNRPFSEILQYYGMERFLYRFSCSKYADKFVLKGALMFTVWQVPERRTTLDIDFLANYDKRIKEEMEYEGVRVKFIGLLGRSRIPMQIDVGFGDAVYPAPKVIDYPVILDFPKPHLRGYPPESIVSEKFEAMVKLGLLNSRMKDFYDIWLMMHQFSFNGLNLVEALKKTFKRRKTALPKDKPFFVEEIYDEKSDRQTLWRAFLKKGDIKLAPERLSDTAREIENFLTEPVDAVNSNYEFHKVWDISGIWK